MPKDALALMADMQSALAIASARMNAFSARADAEFNEADHPRAKDGKFGSGGGSSKVSSGGSDEYESPWTGARIKPKMTLSLDATLKLAEKKSPDIVSVVRKLAGNVKVSIVAQSDIDKLTDIKGVGGFYDANTDRILLGAEAAADVQDAADLALHEGLHAAFHNTIQKDKTAAKLVGHLLNEASKTGKGHYGLTNEHEFISEAFSNPVFQKFLRDTPAPRSLVSELSSELGGEPSLWDVFVEFVKRTLKINAKTSLMDATIAVTNILERTAKTKGRIRDDAASMAVSMLDAVAELSRRLDGICAHSDAEFKESDHPRAEDGKFGSGSGSAAGSSSKGAKHKTYKADKPAFATPPSDVDETSESEFEDDDGETYVYDIAHVKDGDQVKTFIYNISSRGDDEQTSPAEGKLGKVAMYKLKKKLAEQAKGQAEDYAELETEGDRWDSLSEDEQEAEIEAQRKESEKKESEKNTEIESSVDKAMEDGWKPTKNKWGEWITHIKGEVPESVRQFASPKSIAKIRAKIDLLEKQGKLKVADEFRESDHPRAGDGKFGSGNGGSSSPGSNEGGTETKGSESGTPKAAESKEVEAAAAKAVSSWFKRGNVSKAISSAMASTKSKAKDSEIVKGALGAALNAAIGHYWLGHTDFDALIISDAIQNIEVGLAITKSQAKETLMVVVDRLILAHKSAAKADAEGDDDNDIMRALIAMRKGLSDTKADAEPHMPIVLGKVIIVQDMGNAMSALDAIIKRMDEFENKMAVK